MANIENFINAMIDQNHAQSGNMFNDIISQKVGDALEAEKIAVAGQIFNGEDDAEYDNDAVSDEDLAAAAAEVADEDELDELDMEVDDIEDVTDEVAEDDPVADVEELADEEV